MRAKIVKDYFASQKVFDIAEKNGLIYHGEGAIVHDPTKEDPFYHILLDVHPLMKKKQKLLVTYLNKEDFILI